MGKCDARQEYYANAGDDPTLIAETWLNAQVCDELGVELQYCWVAGDYVYFYIHIDTHSDLVGVEPPTANRRILINDLNEILRNNLDAELYWETIE